MLIDSFIFFNECDLLDARLEYLSPIVDKFIIVESLYGFNGNTKPLNFYRNSNRYSKYWSKIHYVLYYHDTTIKNPWYHEVNQRNKITEHLPILNLDPDSKIIIGDVDEIPKISVIQEANLDVEPAYVLNQDMFVYNLKQKMIKQQKTCAITKVGYAIEKGAQWFRNSREELPVIDNAGWHLTYWGDPEKIKYKIQNFSHQELNTPHWTDVNRIKENIKEGRDPFDRDRIFNDIDEQVIMEKVDRNSLPEELLKHFEKYEVII